MSLPGGVGLQLNSLGPYPHVPGGPTRGPAILTSVFTARTWGTRYGSVLHRRHLIDALSFWCS